LPFDFRHLYSTINEYTKNLIDELQQMKESTDIENKLLKNNDYTLASDPTKTYIQPKPKDEVPYLDFSSLQNALSSLQKSADSLQVMWNKAISSNINHDAFNQALYKAEQQLLTTDGLPRRSWYKHSLYAPGFYTGYGVKTLPGIREAIEQRNWKEAQQQINIDAETINKFAAYLLSTASLQ
jgi:N-acetylated-alpha-linked acidic dipeptidase